MASIFTRKDRGGQICVAWIDATGIRRSQFFPRHQRTAAKKFAVRMQAEADAGRGAVPCVTLESAVVYYLEDRRQCCAAGTWMRYRSVMVPFAEMLGPATPLPRITTHQLTEWRNAKLGERQRSTVRNDCKCLVAFFRWCIARGWLEKSPMIGVEIPRVKRTIPAFLAPADLERVIAESAQHPRREFYLITVLAADCGLRRNEILHLPWRHVDLNNRTLTIIGKSKDPRVVPLSTRAHAALMDWPQEGPQVFPPRYKVANLRSPELAWEYNDWLKSLNLGITLHGLRHSFAVRLVSRGASERAVGDLLGHQSLETTRLYARSHLDYLRSLVDPSAATPPTTPPPKSRTPAPTPERTENTPAPSAP